MRSNGTDTSAAVSIELNVDDRNEPGILKMNANYKMTSKELQYYNFEFGLNLEFQCLY